MVIAKQAVASITMGDPTTDIYLRSLVSRHKVAIQQDSFICELSCLPDPMRRRRAANSR
jgi:hypothetical protein